jgi:hypothetical protein
MELDHLLLAQLPIKQRWKKLRTALPACDRSRASLLVKKSCVNRGPRAAATLLYISSIHMQPLLLAGRQAQPAARARARVGRWPWAAGAWRDGAGGAPPDAVTQLRYSASVWLVD